MIGLNSSGLSLEYPSAGLNVPVPSGATTVVLASSLSAGIPYTVTVGTQPADENCMATNDSGTSDTSGTLSGNVNVTITCFPASSGFVLHSFAGGADGADPWAALIQASDGSFYGTTFAGGAYGDRTVFRITPAGVETVLHSFAGGSDGREPVGAVLPPSGGVIQARNGNFYGTAPSGGANNEGTVGQVNPL